MNVWDIPMYYPTMVSHLVGLSVGRVKRWLHGYDYYYIITSSDEIKTGHKEPIIKRSESEESHYASFLDLIDLLFVKSFLRYGITLQKIRKALQEAERLLGGHHFAQRHFFTDGKQIYLQVKDNADALLELLSGGQWVISDIIKHLAHQIDFDEPTGFARRWYPLGSKGFIVVDPTISFGRPIIKNRAVLTSNIYDLYLGENKNIKKVCSWMKLNVNEVEAAVKFEQSLVAA